MQSRRVRDLHRPDDIRKWYEAADLNGDGDRALPEGIENPVTSTSASNINFSHPHTHSRLQSHSTSFSYGPCHTPHWTLARARSRERFESMTRTPPAVRVQRDHWTSSNLSGYAMTWALQNVSLISPFTSLHKLLRSSSAIPPSQPAPPFSALTTDYTYHAPPLPASLLHRQVYHLPVSAGLPSGMRTAVDRVGRGKERQVNMLFEHPIIVVLTQPHQAEGLQ